MPLSTGQILQQRYRILGPLGQGGMGTVYLAEDLRLERRCAVKEQIPDPNAAAYALAQRRQQFRTEARTLAGLDHPNLPKVYDYFEYSGNEYIVLEYVEGENLAIVLRRQGGPLPEATVLAWADQVLDALEYMHGQQPRPVVHRDIKPANIILTPQGKVKLVDFGLVKLFDPFAPGTMTALRGAGTPEFTPLEQYASGQGHTDARSDIYSLGGTLYNLLTGIVPADSARRSLDPSALAPPRQLNPGLSASTETAILRAIEVHPDRRFQTAREMRQALAGAGAQPKLGPTVFIAPPSVASARPPATRPTPIPRWLPWAIIGVAAVLLGGLGVWRLAVSATTRPTAMAVAQPANPSPTSVIAGALTAVPSVAEPDASPAVTRRSTLTPTLSSVTSPRSKPTPAPQLPVLSGTPVPQQAGPIAPANASDVVQLTRWGEDVLTEAAFSPDGRLLAVATSRGIYLHDSTELEQVRFIETLAYVTSVAFSPDGATLASGSDDETVRLWRVADGAPLRTLEGHTDYVRSVAFSPDGATLASGSGDNTVRLWGVADGAALRTLEGHTSFVTSVAFSPDGATLASGSGDKTVRLWRVADGAHLRTLEGHTLFVMSVAFSPEGATLASGSPDGTVLLWGVPR